MCYCVFVLSCVSDSTRCVTVYSCCHNIEGVAHSRVSSCSMLHVLSSESNPGCLLICAAPPSLTSSGVLVNLGGGGFINQRLFASQSDFLLKFFLVGKRKINYTIKKLSWS